LKNSPDETPYLQACNFPRWAIRVSFHNITRMVTQV